MLDAHSPRRTVLLGAGLGAAAAALASCSSQGTESGAAPSGTPTVVTSTADVPVGSAVIVGDVVITQPAAGDFRGFSSVCPHAGCNVSKVVDAVIVCPCHGSEFGLDGSVVTGPASKPLAAKTITVQGDAIVAS